MKTVKRKVCRKGYMLGYWKGERVALIPQFHPDANPGEYVIEELELPIDHPFPKIIDPNETPLSEIKEICIFNRLPFSWITGIDLKDEQAIKTTAQDSLYKAIEHFITSSTCGTTTAQYRRIFDDLIREKVIDPQTSIDAYSQRTAEVETSALKFSYLESGSDRHYNYNDKIYNMIRSFHAFLTTLQCPGVKKKKGGRFYRVKRKNCLTEKEAQLLFSALKEVNPIHELIARILWWFNCETYDHPDAPVIHLESILRMQISDIGTDSLAAIRDTLPDNAGGNSISVLSHTLSSYKIISCYVPGTMYAGLAALACNTDLFLFRNRSGAPIDPRLVRRSFSKACKRSNLRNITPNQLR